MAKLQFQDVLIYVDSKCCHSFPFHTAVSPVLRVLEIFVLTVAWNVFNHISWHYAINRLKMQGGNFFPCSAVQDCEAVVVFALRFILSDAEVQSWKSVLLKWRGPLWLNPTVVFLQQYQQRSWQWCRLLPHPRQGRGSTRSSPCKPFCSGPCFHNRGPWYLCDASRTVLMGKGDSCVHQVSVSPEFCYNGLESSWEVLPAWVVACGVFLHWLFPCGSTCSAGAQLTKGGSGITSTWKSTNCT